jgi:putative transport protein
MLAVFLGILLGVLAGSVPIAFPGLPAPAKLGLAGGPLLVAILMGWKRRIGSIDFHLSTGANLFMREIGIVLFLGAVGLGSGKPFVETLRSGQGLLWMGYGAIITFVPIFVVAMIARWRGLNYLTITGVLAGATTDPPALGYANSLSSSQAQSVGYASVYPLTMFLRVIAAQILVMLLAS